MDTRDSEIDMVELDVIYDNDREYVAETIEKATDKPSKGHSRKKNHVRLYKREV